MKSRYDYVLLDTAPIGMVTDTAIISRVADMCVYVCRADVTPKAAFCYMVMAMVNIMVMDTAMGMVLRQRIRKENNWI